MKLKRLLSEGSDVLLVPPLTFRGGWVSSKRLKLLPSEEGTFPLAQRQNS